MKIITAQKAYVQLKDLEVLFASYDGPTPDTITQKYLLKSILFINGAKFFEFTDPTEIEFFRSLDWSVDYLTLKDLKEDQLNDLIYLAEQEKKELVKDCEELRYYERPNNSRMTRKAELLEFKVDSLIDVLEFKTGKLEIILPSEFVDSDAYEDFSQKLTPVKETGIKRFLKLPIKNKKN